MATPNYIQNSQASHTRARHNGPADGHSRLPTRVWIACLTTILAQCCATLAADEPTRPNVVLILADDLGYTDLGCYGNKYYETPNIDRLAESGLRFTSGYTCGPNCQPTRAALLSGQYGPRTGVYTVGGINRFDWQSRPLRPVDNVTELPLSKVTLADALKSAGYATAMFGKWHLGNDAKYHPAKRGFDEAIVSQGRHFKFATNPRTPHAPDEYLADFLTDRAVEFVRRHKDKPFFLYLPHFAVHTPLQAKSELIANFDSKSPVAGHHDPTYAAMITSVDESVSRIVALLDELKLSKNTLVIFTSDNGGVGGYRREGVHATDITNNAPLKGGKGMLYEGGVRVPYIFRWPGTIDAGGTCAVPINTVDLYPTLLELCGGRAASDHPLDGTSYAGLLADPNVAAATRDPIYWHFPGYLGSGDDTWRTLPVGAIRAGDWKLLEFFEDGRLELYNLADDIGETRNLADDMPERTADMHKRLIAWRESVGAPMPTKNANRQPPRPTKNGRQRRARPNRK